MDMAGIDWENTTENVELGGYSVMPFLMASQNSGEEEVLGEETKVYDEFGKVGAVLGDRPNYAMSQFHGDEIHLSWFLLREDEWKYVVYGSGKEVPPRLFNLVADPLEMD